MDNLNMAKIDLYQTSTKNGLEIQIRSHNLDDISLLKDFQDGMANESTHTYKYPEQIRPDEDKAKKLILNSLDHPFDIHIGAFHQGKRMGVKL